MCVCVAKFGQVHAPVLFRTRPSNQIAVLLHKPPFRALSRCLHRRARPAAAVRRAGTKGRNRGRCIPRRRRLGRDCGPPATVVRRAPSALAERPMTPTVRSAGVRLCKIHRFFKTEFKFQTIRGLRGSDCDPARPLRPSSRFTHRPLLRSRPPAAHPRRRRRPQPPPSPPPAQQLSARTGRSSCRICRMCQSAPVDSTVVGTGVAERRRRGRERTPSPQAASRSSPPPQPPPARRTTGRPYRSAGEEWGGGVAGESRGGRAAHRDEVSDVRGRHDSVSALQPPPALEVCGRAQAEREAQQAAGQPRRVA